MTNTLTRVSLRRGSLMGALVLLGLGNAGIGCDRGLLSTADEGYDGGSGGTAGSADAGANSGGTGGAATFTVGDAISGPSGSVMMFVPDDLAGALYRYAIMPGADPVLTATIPVPSASSVAMSPKGELFTSTTSPPQIYKVTSPLAIPTVKGPLAIGGQSVLGRFDIKTLFFVDDDLGLTSPGMSNAWFLRFDTQGSPAISWGLPGMAALPSCAGVLWNPATRVLYVSQLFPSGGTIQAYRIGGDHSTTRLADITGNGLGGPDGLAFSPWGELFVANYYAGTISRFTLDAQGSATANGTLAGNGMTNPTSVAFAPWGELFVGNQGTGTLSRFTFDAAHASAGQGTFQTACKANPGGNGSTASRMDWIAIPAQAWSSTGSAGSSGGASGSVVDGGTGGQAGVLVDAGSVGGSSGGAGGAAGTAGGATLFVPDDLANALHRYFIQPGAEPALDTTIPVPSAASVALRTTGELFVASYAPPGLYKVTSPFRSPTVSGPLTISGISVLGRFDVRSMAFVDDDLGLVSPGMSGISFLTFDTQGTPGLSRGMTNAPSCSGVLWSPDTRVLYVSQRFPSGGVIQAWRIGSDHSPTRLADIAGNGLGGPDGMAFTPWGELLVANYYAHTISRFLVDAQGSATANGTITGNGLDYPSGMAVAPWGELYVGNQGSGALSRFTFDAGHAAVASGTFQTACKASPGGSAANGSRMDWISIFPQGGT